MTEFATYGPVKLGIYKQSNHLTSTRRELPNSFGAAQFLFGYEIIALQPNVLEWSVQNCAVSVDSSLVLSGANHL